LKTLAQHLDEMEWLIAEAKAGADHVSSVTSIRAHMIAIGTHVRPGNPAAMAQAEWSMSQAVSAYANLFSSADGQVEAAAIESKFMRYRAAVEGRDA
jgi:hypothetical protein